MTKSVLALDLATHTGWAHWREGLKSPVYGTIELSPGADIGRFILDFRHELTNMLATYKITDVAYERPWVNPGRDDENLIMKLFGLGTETAATSRAAGAGYQAIETKAMRKFWTGTAHHEDKRKDLSYVRSDGRRQVCNSPRDVGKYWSIVHARDVKKWAEVENDDEADALGILCFYCALHKIAVPWDNAGCPSPQFLELAAKGRIIA